MTHAFVVAILAAAAAMLAAPGADAGADTRGPAAGSYRCSSYNVSGGGGSCRNMPPLVLNADGTYQYSSTRGRWSVQDDKVRLSESSLWGAGDVVGRETIRFAYDYRGWQHVVTWTCPGCARDDAPPAARDTAPATSFAGVSLVLEFGQAIGGVSTFTIVPAEAAAGYRHNAPLPRGAVQGLARETGRSTVAIETNRNNQLRTGARYVVFLSWPRETLPVAILDLPATSGDYSGSLPATLDGPSVLARLVSRPAAPAPGGAAERTAPRPIGVEIVDVTPEIAAAVGDRSLRGAGVRRVVSGSPASRAGVQEGDIITAVNGVAIASASEAAATLARRGPGETAQLAIFRAGRLVDVRVGD